MNVDPGNIDHGSRNAHKNIFMEVTMTTIFIAIIVFSVIVLLGG
jgi:hypothetical protein